MAFAEFMPGASVVGISYSDGVILAADKRISFGNFVVNKNIKKTFTVTDYVGSGMRRDGRRHAGTCKAGRGIGQDP